MISVLKLSVEIVRNVMKAVVRLRSAVRIQIVETALSVTVITSVLKRNVVAVKSVKKISVHP